ncbi:hypothetical protein CMK18_23320 [Candidatus Poribacteria bacterium]|nr:hypothetical protein [Candidatus Poribacteria bacterium]
MSYVPDSVYQTEVRFGAVSTSLDGWKQESGWTLKSINALCPNVSADHEYCDSGPFSEFTIRGTQGDAENDGRWWWQTDNTLGLSNYDGGSDRSGAMRIKVREGYQVKLEFKFETRGEYGFQERFEDQFSDASYGVVSKDSESTIVILKAGDYLDVDIDSDWSGIARFDIKVQGSDLYSNTDKSIDDEVYITLLDVYVEDDSTGGNGGGSGVDCVVSAWSAWSAWSDNECGTRTRNRTVVTPASGGGNVCSHLNEEESKDCDTGESKITTSGGGEGGEGDNNDDGDDSEETPYLLYGLGGLAFVALLITLKK